jgi:RNA polymerase sigma-70 factor (ECF subfamily)
MRAGNGEDTLGVADRLLIEAVLSGDPDAFRGLVERESATVLTVCRRILSDPTEAEDAAQDAFLIAYRKLGSFRGDGPLGGWLMRIATREAWRRAQRRPEGSVLDPEIDVSPADPTTTRTDPVEIAEAVERGRELRAAIDGLPTHHRDAVRLRYLDDLSYEEIAAATGRQEATVRTHVHRGLTRLRELLTVEARS